MGGSREGGRGLDSPGKSQVVTRFLRNSGTDLPREAIVPPSRSNWTQGSNCFSREVRTIPLGPIASRGKSVRSPWVKFLLEGSPYDHIGPNCFSREENSRLGFIESVYEN